MVNADAAQRLRELEGVRRSTRRLFAYPWVPFAVFGAITMGSAAFTGVWEGAGVGLWWFVVGPLGLGFVMRYYRTRELDLGFIDRREYFYAGVLTAMFAAGFALGWAGGGGLVSDVGPTFAVAAGLLALALVDRSAVVATSAVAQIALALAVTLAEPSHAGPLMALAAGAILMATGLVLRRRDPAAR